MYLNNFLMLNVGYARHDSDWNFKNINSPFARIYYVTRGNAIVEIGEMCHELTPGHLYLIPPFTTHSDISSGIFCHYYVHVYEETTTGDDLMSMYDFPFEIEGREIDRLLFECLAGSNEAMTLKSSDPRMYDNEHSLIKCVSHSRRLPLDVRMEAAGIISQLMGRFVRYAIPKYIATDGRIQQTLRRLSRSIDSNVAIEELARDARMSAGHFIRLFKRELGCTPTQFLIGRKMMKAKLMLASESLMMKEIAYKLGYEDVSYFSRLFKKHTGITPLAYRQNYNTNI